VEDACNTQRVFKEVVSFKKKLHIMVWEPIVIQNSSVNQHERNRKCLKLVCVHEGYPWRFQEHEFDTEELQQDT